MIIKIATRESELALFQANFVAKKINELDKKIQIELVPMKSVGDQTEQPLHEIGGKGLFISKLESSLRKGDCDIAVHSLKDVPAKLEKDFTIAAVFERESSSDMLLSKKGLSILDFPVGSVIGSSSPRRKAQIKYIRPDLEVIPVRGNIATRIKKLNDNLFDGLVVAKAAMNRLELNTDKCYEFTNKEMLPSASQGYVAVECLSSNTEIIKILNQINNSKAMSLANAERLFVSSLNGSCLSPISVLCCETLSGIQISARVLSQGGDEQIFREIKSSYENIHDDIILLADEFLSNDAHNMILR